jgi:hypothetical protein
MLNALRPLLLLVASLGALSAVAQDAPAPPPAPTPPPIEVRSQREDAGARIRQVERAGGRVLQAEPMQRGGQEVYRFKVLTPEGRVRVMQGDPRDAGTDPFREDRETRRRQQQLGFDRQSELTARRREFRDDAGTDVARERQQQRSERAQRQTEQPRTTRAAGESAGD